MELAASILVFVVSHVVIARGPLKPMFIDRFGTAAYLSFYSVLSIALLGWIVSAMLRAPTIDLWDMPGWAYGVALALTPLAFVLLGVGLNSPNPVSVSFRRTGFDPARPGVVGYLRHPTLMGFGLWGLAHIPANGDTSALMLFGGTIAFAAIGAIGLNKRYQRTLGVDAWHATTQAPGHVDRNAVVGAVAGLVVWAGFLMLHPYLFGADPLAAFGTG